MVPLLLKCLDVACFCQSHNGKIMPSLLKGLQKHGALTVQVPVQTACAPTHPDIHLYQYVAIYIDTYTYSYT